MSVGTLLGWVVGITVLTWAIVSSAGNADIFWYPPGLAIVLGGVVASTLVCYPLPTVFGVLLTFVKALRRDDLPVAHYIGELHVLAQLAVEGGTARLESELAGIENYFLRDGLRMLVDRYPPQKVREIMESAIDSARERELASAAIVRTMARFSPAFGMVGTLIGLIVMFRNMGEDLSAVGPGMAIAVMTTLYGLILAYLVFLPIAIKIERRADERVLLMRVIMEGVILVSKRTPPQLVTDELKAFLPPGRWSDIRLRRSGAEPPGEETSP